MNKQKSWNFLLAQQAKLEGVPSFLRKGMEKSAIEQANRDTLDFLENRVASIWAKEEKDLDDYDHWYLVVAIPEIRTLRRRLGLRKYQPPVTEPVPTPCGYCGVALPMATKRRKFCGVRCRVAYHRLGRSPT
jgi:hypothetical protein